MNPVSEAKEFESIMETVIEQGLDGILPAMKLLLDFAMKQERSQYLQAAPYERSDERLGYANGYKPKTIQTRVISLFPNPDSCLRLVTSILQEIHEEWMVGKIYLSNVEEELEENPVTQFYRKIVA